jgi:hypothetical protein
MMQSMFDPTNSESVRSGPELTGAGLTGLARTNLEPADLGLVDLKLAPNHSPQAAPVACRSHRPACRRLAQFHPLESPAPQANPQTISSLTVLPFLTLPFS